MQPCIQVPGSAEGFGARTKKALVHEANYKSSLIKCDNYDSASWYKTPFWLHHPFLSHALSSCHLLFPSFSLLPFFANTQTVISFFTSNTLYHFPTSCILSSTIKTKSIIYHFSGDRHKSDALKIHIKVN